MKFDSVRVPKEIYQKETIAIHIPKINRPLTYRQLYFIMPGFAISFIIQLIWASLIKLPVIIEEKIFDICLRLMIFIAVPIVAGIFSTMKKNGLYMEQRLFQRAKYKRNKGVVLNEKAIRAMANIKGKGGK